MAECGACRSQIPIDSTSCPDCGVSFSGVAEDDMGECGACGVLLPMDSKSCSECGVQFVLDDLTTALSVWMKDEGLTISELFAQVDADNDHSLSADEVKQALEGRNLAFLGTNELDRFLSQIDLNDDGVISFAELAAALSMPWTPPSEKIVLEPDVSSEVEVEEIDDSEDDDDEEEEDSDHDDDGEDEDDSDDDDDEDEEDSDDDDDGDEDDSDDDDDEEDEDSDDDDDDEDEEDSDDDDDEEDEDSDDDGEDASEDDSEDDTDSTDDDWEESESPEDSETDGPSDMQKFLIKNYENVFPILYTIFAIFVIGWAVNGTIGFIDGSGGNVAYNGETASFDMNGDGWIDASESLTEGDIYPCDDEIQVGGCDNSLTLLAGESGDNGMFNSMPTGFYWDGILFIILGLAGIGGTGYLQVQTKKMRTELRKKKSGDNADEESESSDDTDDDDQVDSDDGDDDSDEDEVESDGGGDDSGDDEDDTDADESEEDDSEDDGDQEEDGIEIGSRVGVEDEDGDWYGEVVEFDDSEDAVVVKREDDGEEYLVDWDSLFQDD